MWVYTEKGDVAARLSLPATTAFWLDYWLFLHAEETHPLLRHRPFGLGSLAELGQQMSLPRDKVLARAHAKEVGSYLRLAPFLDKTQKPPQSEPIDHDGALSADWKSWLAQAEDDHFCENVRTSLGEGVATASEEGNLNLLAFLTRRLASEIAEVRLSERSTSQLVKREILYEGATLSALVTRIGHEPIKREFRIHFFVNPVSVTTRIARLRFGPVSLITEAKADSSAISLAGLACTIASHDVQEAKLAALNAARLALNQLRLRHYVRTHIYGTALASDGSEDPIHLSLPQPFWTKQSGRRRVPSIPPRLGSLMRAMPAEHALRWSGARWHASQSIGYWIEDAYSAASEVWQAIESFLGTPLQASLKEARCDYLGLTPDSVLEDLAIKHSLQASRIPECDWYYWVSRRSTVRQWLWAVLNTESRARFSTWESPRAFDIGFHPDVGLIAEMARWIRIGIPGWTRERLKRDLEFLYGLRNAVVHDGRTLGSVRWAYYLARTGLEFLFELMNDRALVHALPVESKAEADS